MKNYSLKKIIYFILFLRDMFKSKHKMSFIKNTFRLQNIINTKKARKYLTFTKAHFEHIHILK